MKNQEENIKPLYFTAVCEITSKVGGRATLVNPTRITTPDPAGIKGEIVREKISNSEFSKFDEGFKFIGIFEVPHHNKIIPFQTVPYQEGREYMITLDAKPENVELAYDILKSVYKLDEAKFREGIKDGGKLMIVKSADPLFIGNTYCKLAAAGLADNLKIDESVIDEKMILLENFMPESAQPKSVKKLLKVLRKGYQLPEQLRNFATHIFPMVFEKNRILNVRLLGPSGTGKTTFPQALADHYEIESITVNCQLISNPRQWFGKLMLDENGKTYFKKSRLAERMEQGKVVIIFDEINRVSPDDLNGVLTLFDDNRSVHLEDVNVSITVGEGTVFVVTYNEGAGFTGTNQLDRAMENRFPITYQFVPLTKAQELALMQYHFKSEVDFYTPEKAETIYKIFDDIRKHFIKNEIDSDASVRPLLQVAELVFLYGRPIGEAVVATMMNRFSDKENRKAIQELIQRHTLEALPEASM